MGHVAVNYTHSDTHTHTYRECQVFSIDIHQLQLKRSSLVLVRILNGDANTVTVVLTSQSHSIIIPPTPDDLQETSQKKKKMVSN